MSLLLERSFTSIVNLPGTTVMIEEVLKSIAASLKAVTKEKTDLIENADFVREQLQSELDTIVDGVAEKEEEILKFEETLDADETKFAECIPA